MAKSPKKSGKKNKKKSTKKSYSVSKSSQKHRPQHKAQHRSQDKSQDKSQSQASQLVELEFLAGLKDSVKAELKSSGLIKQISHLKESKDSLSFNYYGKLANLRKLRTVIAAYAVQHFEVPRPKALLGHEHWTSMLIFLKEIKQLDDFKSFRFSAAGKDSIVFHRLRDDLAKGLNLRHDDEGDFLLRFRAHEGGWQVLARISKRPLSARAWRRCNIAGGLNATVAASMVSIANIRTKDRIYCPMCGSGTLAIETALAHQLEQPILASDISESAHNCAIENIVALPSRIDINLYQDDVTQSKLEDASVDIVLVNMPWGDAISTIEDNSKLYPAFFTEMHRILSPNGRILLLTHDIRRFEAFINKSNWHYEEKLQVYHGGHNPRLYLLKK